MKNMKNETKTLKGKIKVNQILVDDEQLAYRVSEVFTNSVVVEEIVNRGNFSAEIMSYKALDNEGWIIANN